MKRALIILLIITAISLRAYTQDSIYVEVAGENRPYTEIFDGWFRNIRYDTLSTKILYDRVISDYNSIVRGIAGDTLFYLINNNQELQSLANNVDLDIDFDNNCIIWGRFISPITSGTILSNNLYYDSQNLIYNYIVNIYIPSSGYTARKGLYFWGIYPKPNHNVIFTLNSNNKKYSKIS
jgi:hypothetical protein